MAKRVATELRPMLAVDADDLDALHYPLLASFKMDGIRALITPEGARTRSMKPIPNKYTHALLGTLPPGLDGEIGVLGSDGAINFRATTSAVMSHEGEPDVVYLIFDNYLTPGPFLERYESLPHGLPNWVSRIEQRVLDNATQVRLMFAEALERGYEGLILRRADAPYKFGRSTLKEQGLLKVKPWEDAEGLIVGMVPEYENTNEQTRDERGYAKRSSKKEGKVQRERLGAFVLQSERWPGTFECGTGLTHADKEKFWGMQNELIGKVHIRFSFITVGGYDVPRHCVFQGIRMAEDM